MCSRRGKCLTCIPDGLLPVDHPPSKENIDMVRQPVICVFAPGRHGTFASIGQVPAISNLFEQVHESEHRAENFLGWLLVRSSQIRGPIRDQGGFALSLPHVPESAWRCFRHLRKRSKRQLSSHFRRRVLAQLRLLAKCEAHVLCDLRFNVDMARQPRRMVLLDCLLFGHT